MSLANTLSVLLNFKTDLSGLNRFVAAINSRLARVQELNKALANGSAAVNAALQTAGGFLAASALKSYVGEAIQARTAQAKLAQSLTQTGQNSAEYRAELGAYASALQVVTGIEDEVIAAVQRQLVFAGAQRKDIADLTRLTLDFASAKEVDAVSAAKAVGRALQGEGDELKRYGVEVDLTKSKVEGLRDGLGKFSGQASQAFAALPEGMRQFRVASKEAQQAAGEAVLAISNPFLAGLAGGLRTIRERFAEIEEGGSAVQSVLRGIAGGLGSFLGANLDKLAVLAISLLALKAGSYALSEGLKVVASGFLALTGQSLPAMLAGLRSLTKEVGLLQALSLGGWPAKLALGLAAVAGALAVFTVGSIVISGIEQAQLSRIEREQKTAEVMWDQLKALQQQIGAVKTFGEARAAQLRADEALVAAEKRASELRAKKETSAAELQRVSRSRSDAALPRENLLISEKDEQELALLEQQLPMLKRAQVTAYDPGAIDRRLNENDKPRQAALTAEEEKARLEQEELERKRALYELGTLIAEAEAAGDTERVQNLRDEITELQAIEELGAKHEMLGGPVRDSVTRRLAAEAATRAQAAAKEKADKQAQIDLARQQAELELAIDEAVADGNQALADRLTDERTELQLRRDLVDASVDDAARINEVNQLILDRLALTDQVRQKERQRAAEERALQNKLGALDIDIATIESDRYRTQERKNADLLPKLQDKNAALQTRIEQLQERKKTAAPTDALQIDAEIQGHQKEKAGIQTQITAAKPQTIGEGIQQGVSGQGGFLESLGTAAQNAAGFVNGTLNAALQGTSDLLYNLATGSMTFAQAWGQATLQVGQQFLRMATDMVAKMIWRATVEKMLLALSVTNHGGAEVAKTAATTAGGGMRLGVMIKEAMASVYKGAVQAFEALSSIPYVGPFLGAAAMAAALVGGIALVSKIGGHADGGLIAGPGGPTDDRVPAMLSAGEHVTRAKVVGQLGVPFFDRLNAGVVDLTALPGRAARSFVRGAQGATAVVAAFASGGLVQAAPAAAGDAYAPPIYSPASLDPVANLSAVVNNIAALPAAVTRGMAQPAPLAGATGAGAPAGPPTAAAGESAGTPTAAGAPDVKIYNAFFTDRPSAEQWLKSKDGRRNLIRMRGEHGHET